MKVLQINTVCGKGSTGTIAVGLNEAIKKSSGKGIVAYGVGATSYKDSYKIGNKFNYYFHNIMSRLFGHEGFYSVITTRKFLKWVNAYNPDIIHLHNLHGHYINIKLLFEYIKEKNIPVVWTLHDCWAFTGKCVHFEHIGCNKWHNKCYNCPEISEYPFSIIDTSSQDYIKKMNIFNSVESMTIVTPSNWLAELLKNSYLKKYNVTVINNGIDTNIFRPIKLNDKALEKRLSGKFVILGVASPWSNRKGFDDFVKIAQHFYDNDDIIFIMVGLDDNQIKAISENIIGINRTDSAQILAQIYSRADVFLNPTYEDNYPSVNLEALACGTPIVTYDIGGSPEAVRKYNGGCIVDKCNVNALINKINSMRYNNFNMIEVDRNQLSYINSNQQYLDIYKRIK